jgi:hypothetical protein
MAPSLAMRLWLIACAKVCKKNKLAKQIGKFIEIQP